jgi:hypothetical protein
MFGALIDTRRAAMMHFFSLLKSATWVSRTRSP